jgi:TPP-dependent pyruvate/acetoin dehydrogenase alpha subunit
VTIAQTTAEQSTNDVELYRQLALIRRFEELAYRAYEAGEIAGTIHASIGQEAVAVGAVAALQPADVVFTHHRGHGHALAKGVDPVRLFAELLGRRAGVSGGKGGSMHATDVEVGFFVSYAVVGGSIPLAVGVALAARRRGLDTVAVSMFGDGAVNQGVLYESLNLARIWSLPVVFLCENNRYAISVSAEYSTSGEGIARRAEGFGLASAVVDGQSVHAMRDAVAGLAAGARAGEPAVLEAMTYRLLGHSRGDPAHGVYRSRDEVDEWSKRDPLVVHADEAGLPAETCRRAREEADAVMAAALEQARQLPVPAADDAVSEVWG